MPAKTYVLTEILDYVETHTASGVGFGISQRELAQALGYHPCSMSRPLERLVGEGRLTTRRGLVRGGIRKQLVYHLTSDGRTLLKRSTRSAPMIPAAIPLPPRPFVGRTEELRQLAELSRVPGSVLWVEGAPGMGKSALVAQHIRRLKHGRIPCWFAVHPGSAPRHFVEAIAHALASVGPSQIAYYAQTPRAPVGRELASLALRALGDTPLLLVVDDAHVAGRDLQAFLAEFLLAMRSEARLLALLISQEAPFLPADQMEVERLVIGGLDRASAHELTDRLGGLADRFESVFQSSLGSPLVLQLALETPDVEATLQNLPDALVARMPTDEVEKLLPVALANEPLPESFLSEVSGLEPSRIEQLTRTGLLHPALSGRVEILESIRKALVARGRPYELDAHRVLATYYGRSRRTESVRERFVHLVAGEDWRNASELLATEERKMLSLGYSDALRNALTHMALGVPPGAPRVRALRVQAELLRAHAEYSDAILLLRRAIGESSNDPRTTAECLLQIVEMLLRQRLVDEAAATLEQARAIPVATRRVRVFLALSEARIAEGRADLVRALAMFQDTFEAARRGRIADLALEALAAWSRVAAVGGSQEEALRIVEEGLPQARESGRIDLVFNLLLVRARAYQETGRPELAELEMRKLRAETEALGHLHQLTYTLSGLAATLIDSGRVDEAVEFARQASDLAGRLNNELVLGHTLAVMATGEARQGKLAEARSHAERSVSVLTRLPPSDSLVLARSYLAEIYLVTNEGGLARREYRQAIDLARSMGMDAWAAQVETELGSKIARLGSEGVAGLSSASDQ